MLAGTSYGGNLALEIALATPERVLGLWLMGCDAGAAQQGGPDLAAGLEATPDAVIDLLAGLVVRPTDTVSASTFRQMAARVGGTAGAAQARALGTRVDRTDWLAELTMPTLLTWGADDPLVPASAGQAMANHIHHAAWHVLPQCGHLPALEQPKQSAALLSALIKTVAA